MMFWTWFRPDSRIHSTVTETLAVAAISSLEGSLHFYSTKHCQVGEMGGIYRKLVYLHLTVAFCCYYKKKCIRCNSLL